jgi:hypothetical protein
MSFRTVLVHACFDQRLGQERPARCKCQYRITNEQAQEFVVQGKADWVIVAYKNGFPVEGCNLVWGARPTKEEIEAQLVKSAYAAKTPRVQTVEKADIERAYVNQYPEDIERIEVWGEMSKDVIADLTIPWDGSDPFEGRSVILFVTDQRSAARWRK